MKRVVKDPTIRKQELIMIALKQFLHNGYEKTSIRSILKEADGEIGMFYHYFSSKDEIYRASLDLFNHNFLDKLESVTKESNLSFIQRINKMFVCTQYALAEYANLKTDKLNPEMLSTIHRETLLTMLPFLEEMLINEENLKNIELPDIQLHFLSEFLLFGISAIIHDKEEVDFTFKTEQIRKILFQFIKLKC